VTVEVVVLDGGTRVLSLGSTHLEVQLLATAYLLKRRGTLLPWAREVEK
jgi:hypothetical protein